MARLGHDRIHLAGPAGEVHREDGASLRCDRRLDERRVDVLGSTIHVHEDRRDTCVHDRIRSGCECMRRRDHFVPRLEPGSDHRQMQRRGAGVERQGVACPDVAAKILLEPGHARAGSDPAGPERCDHFLDLGLLQRGASEDEKLLPDGAAGSTLDGGSTGFRLHLISPILLRGHNISLKRGVSSA